MKQFHPYTCDGRFGELGLLHVGHTVERKGWVPTQYLLIRDGQWRL